MRRLTIAALALVAMAGCEKESSVDVASDVAVTFAASQIGTRASSDWTGEEMLGIFMYEAGSTSKGTFELARENVLHTSDNTGTFTTDSPIYYPQSGSVDLYAYYPYAGAEGDGTDYSLDLTKQNTASGGFDQAAVDFMTATPITGLTKNSGEVAFTLYHQLSQVTLVLTKQSSLTTLRGVEVSISDVNTAAVFSVIDGAMGSSSTSGSILFMTEETAWDGAVAADSNVTGLTATAILLPETISSSAVITFKVSDTVSYTATFPTTPTFEAGSNHTYNIEVGYLAASFGTTTIDKKWNDTVGNPDATNNSVVLDADEK